MSAGPSELDDIELAALLGAVRARWGYDFTGYMQASVMRRAQRLLADRGESFAELQHAVLRDSAVRDQLVDTLTIQVSDMFRDPPFWRAFVAEVVPILRTYPRSNLWVAGTADGEELWSYAVLLAEHGLGQRVRLYGTDLNPRAVERVRAGTYSAERVRAFTTNWLATGATTPLHTWYRAASGRVRFDPALLEGAVLHPHNLATDDSFVQAHVISCRNVMIYFDDALRARTLDLFRRSLAPHGVLCLGNQETLRFSVVSQAFEELDGAQRIYRQRS